MKDGKTFSTKLADQLEGLRLACLALVQPGKVFDALVARPRYAWPMILGLIASLLFAVTIEKRVGYERVAESLAPMMSQLGMKPVTRYNAANGIRLDYYLSYTADLIWLLIGACAAWLLLLVSMGKRYKWSVIFSCICYGSLPFVVRKLLVVASLWTFVDGETYDPRMPIASAPSALVSQADHPLLYSTLATCDIFTLWCVVLLAVAWVSITRSNSLAARLWIPGLYLIWCMLTIAASAMFA